MMMRLLKCIVLMLSFASAREGEASVFKFKKRTNKCNFDSLGPYARRYASLHPDLFSADLCGQCVTLNGRVKAMIVDECEECAHRADIGVSLRTLRKSTGRPFRKLTAGELRKSTTVTWNIRGCDTDEDDDTYNAPAIDDDATTDETRTGAFKKATATYFWSYPACCHDSPTYDPSADTDECSAYSGCTWMGQFAGLDDMKSHEWVKQHNIASFFEIGQTENSWRRKWRQKTLKIRNPKTMKTMCVQIHDRCDDDDCSYACCTENARKNEGTLIDLEWNTAVRFWGEGQFDGIETIEFAVVDDECAQL